MQGWEIDAVDSTCESYGQSYALGKQIANPQELAKLLMKLRKKMDRRVRGVGYSARGIHISAVCIDWTSWHKGKTFHTELYTTQQIYTKVMLVFNTRPERKLVAKVVVSCFDLSSPTANVQESLFDTTDKKQRDVSA